MHLAQLNIGRLVAPIDDPQIADFVDALDEINALGEATEGFVWRLQDDDGAATSFQPYDDPLVIINLTVWTSVEALADFAYRTHHVDFLRRRREWFEAPSEPMVCLWWIPEGHLPTIEEAVERLAHLRAHGPTPRSFTFRTRFEPDAIDERDARAGSDLDTCPA